MKKHYDFTNAQQGKLHRPLKALHVPVYLDDDVQNALVGKETRRRKNLSKLVNDVLRTQLGMAETLK